MRLPKRLILPVLCGMWSAGPLAAQMPFYTDDPAVTDPGTLHFEFFNEFDGLQSSQFPNIQQNTVNYKLNYGLPHHLEIDVDSPYLAIFRVDGAQTSTGPGDTEFGVKWEFRQATGVLGAPAMAAVFYVEVPTGNVQEQLGSGLADYWLYWAAQEPLTDRTRVNGNAGLYFAGNTSTGVIGTQNKRGQVVTGGLSLLHDFTPHLTLGMEAWAAVADTSGLGKDQLQGLAGGAYEVRPGLSATFAVLGGSHEASPRIGGQAGFEVDFPAVLHPASRSDTDSSKPNLILWRSP